jgi:hypothetical protein
MYVLFVVRSLSWAGDGAHAVNHGQFATVQHYSRLQKIYVEHGACVSNTTLYWISKPTSSRKFDCVQPIMVVSW